MLLLASRDFVARSSTRADWRRPIHRVSSRLVLKRAASIIVVALAAFGPMTSVFADAGPLILATEAVEEAPEVDTTTVPSGAAVDVPVVEEEEVEQPWTQRYMVPTLMLLALVAVGSSVLYYVVRLRSRYTVVE